MNVSGSHSPTAGDASDASRDESPGASPSDAQLRESGANDARIGDTGPVEEPPIGEDSGTAGPPGTEPPVEPPMEEPPREEPPREEPPREEPPPEPVPPDPGVPAQPPAAFQTFFTRPVAGSDDLALEQQIMGLLQATPPGASVRVAMYTWTRTAMARAFADAAARGVDVQIIIDYNNNLTGSAVQTLRTALGSRLVVCREAQRTGGCIGNKINHNKFVLFSSLNDGSQHVVLQSSANFTNPQLRQFNNMVVIRGDVALYNAYSGYWNDLAARRQNPDYYVIHDGQLGTRTYFYPRQSGDTITSILSNTNCALGARIHIAMAFFTDSRIAIAQKLAAMNRQGCAIHVVLNEDSETNSPGTQVKATLRTGNIDLSWYRETDPLHIHSKYLLIEGAYGENNRQQRLVWTGSHNYTGPALTRNDETLLKIAQVEVYDAFLADWRRIRSSAHQLHP